MSKLITLTFCLVFLFTLSGCKWSSTKTGTPVAQQSPVPTSTPPGQTGWDPRTACAQLSDKLKPGDYKLENGNIFRCLSTSKNIGGGETPNNIVYFARGEPLVARQIGLILNVNNPERANDAHRTLLEFSEALSQKVLNVPLSQGTAQAISTGGTGKGRVDTTKVEVLRHDFSNGRGYELHFVITPRL